MGGRFRMMISVLLWIAFIRRSTLNMTRKHFLPSAVFKDVG
jgi:hypothetical protein